MTQSGDWLHKNVSRRQLLKAMKYGAEGLATLEIADLFGMRSTVRPHYFPLDRTSEKFHFGLLPEMTDATLKQDIAHVDTLERRLGAPICKLSVFDHWYKRKPAELQEFFDAIAFSGRVPELSWNLANRGECPSDSFDFARFFDHKPYLESIARMIAALPYPVYIRLGYEMNGEWWPFGYGTSMVSKEHHPEAFAELFANTVDVFKEAGAHNALFVMCPSVYGDIDIFPRYYPPDRFGKVYVDVLSIDFYDTYLYVLPTPEHMKWGNLGPAELVADWLNVLWELGKGKPRVISEFGSGRKPGVSSGVWTGDAIKYAVSNGVFEANYFNMDKNHMNVWASGLWQVSNQPDVCKAKSGKFLNTQTNERDWRLERDLLLMWVVEREFADLRESGILCECGMKNYCTELQTAVNRDIMFNPEILEAVDNSRRQYRLAV